MKFETVKGLDEEKFRRLTGVRRTTFDKMVCILDQSIKSRETNKGRKKTLSVENRLLMTLEYIREYRTYFHISQSYSISESNAYKTVNCINFTFLKPIVVYLSKNFYWSVCLCVIHPFLSLHLNP